MKKLLCLAVVLLMLCLCTTAMATIIHATPTPMPTTSPSGEVMLSMPKNLRIIEEQAFMGSTSIEGPLVIPEGVTEIGARAFEGCAGVTELHLPKSVTLIGSRAFAGTGLSGDIVLRNGVIAASDAFAGCDVQVFYELPESSFYHIPLEGHTYVLDYRGPTVTDMVVPRELAGQTVVGIHNNALANLPGITGRLILPDSVQYIGENAFRGSGFTGPLPWPEHLKEIGKSAYYCCSGFTGDLTIPEGVTVAEWAFAYCGNLTHLDIPKSWTSIPNYAFCGCYKLSGTLHLPPNLVSIGDYAFFKTGFTGELALPEAMKSIGYAAFNQCHGFTGALRLPSSLETIADYAFELCDGFTGQLAFPGSVVSIGESAFAQCTGLTGTPVIPETVRYIGPAAFAGCTQLTGTHFLKEGAVAYSADADCPMEIYVEMPLSYFVFRNTLEGDVSIYAYTGPAYDQDLVIPSQYNGKPVTHIGYDAFRNCTNVSGRLYLPPTITYIDAGAFENCTGLTGGLRLPEGLTYIGSRAFRGCSGFSGSLHIPDSVTSIGLSAFGMLTNMKGSLHLPEGLQVLHNATFHDAGFTGTLDLPQNLTSIGQVAFANCTGFSGSLSIPESVTSIGQHAFSNCTGFNGSLTLPSALTSLGSHAFMGCTGFTGSLAIPEGITSIGMYTFFRMDSMSGDLTLPEGLTDIGNYAFGGSGYRGTLTLPSTLKTIGDFAFNDCGFTGRLNLPEGLTTIGGASFSGCSHLSGSLVIPSTVTVIDANAFSDCTGFQGSLVLPEGLQTIGVSAFRYDSGFSGWVTIPSSVTFIGSYAFEGCTGLRSRIEAADGMTIQADAFRGVTANFTVVRMEAQRAMKESAEQLLLSKMENMLRPDQLFSVIMDDGTGPFERAYQAAVAVIFGNSTSVLMPEVKSEYLFKQAVTAAATNHTVSVYNKEYFGPAMALINGGAAAGSDVYLQALTEHLENDDIAQTLVNLGFEDVIGLYREGTMSDGMVSTYLTNANLSSSYISKVMDGMKRLQKFDLAAQYVKTAGSVVSNFKDDLAAAINQAELLAALDKSDLAETARVFMASSDYDVQLVGRKLNQIAKANTYDQCLALVFAGDLMQVGIDLMVDKLIDMAAGKWASSISLGSAIVNSLTGVGDNYRLVNELTYSSDAARASYAVFQSDLALYRSSGSGRAFTNAYWSYCTYAETAARSLDDFVKIYDHVSATALGKGFLNDEMEDYAIFARNQAASLRRFAASARAMYENLWVTFDPDAFQAEVDRIVNTDYGKPYQ